jgi:hypothetical protein
MLRFTMRRSGHKAATVSVKFHASAEEAAIALVESLYTRHEGDDLLAAIESATKAKIEKALRWGYYAYGTDLEWRPERISSSLDDDPDRVFEAANRRVRDLFPEA